MTLPVALSLVLAVLAAAHAWWAMGGIWPAASEPDLARAVIGDGRIRMPPPWQCAAVAVALVVVAAWPWVIVAWPDSRLVLIGGVRDRRRLLPARPSPAISSRWRSTFHGASRSAPATSTFIRRFAWPWAWASSRC